MDRKEPDQDKAKSSSSKNQPKPEKVSKKTKTQPKTSEVDKDGSSASKSAKSSKVKDENRDTRRLSVKYPDMLSARRPSRRSIDKGPDAESFRKRFQSVGSEFGDARKSIGGTDFNRRRSTVYNPFTSFQKPVTITDPHLREEILGVQKIAVRETQPRQPPVVPVRRLSTHGQELQSPKKNVSVVDLTRQDIAVCLFPEEPDWDSDENLPKEGPEKEENEDDKDVEYDMDRERWHSRLVYLTGMVAYSLSFGNVYQFPAVAYSFGGIPFLIPYTFFTVVMGYPLHFLETALGQYSQSGPVKVWNCAPVARGIGWSMFFLCLFVAYFYNMYAAYSVIYFSRCFKSVLPWQDCDDPSVSNISCVPRMCARNASQNTPAEHYLLDHVFQIDHTSKMLVNGLGPMVWTQVLGFFFAWIVVYVSISQSVRSIGKVASYMIILPYFVLIMLLSAGFMLGGAEYGWRILFSTQFSNLLDLHLWRIAAEEVFFELGICQGTLLAFGSYCHHRNPAHINSAIVCTVNYFTSILASLVLFNILGALSMEMGTTVNTVHEGPASIYIIFPEALSRVPGSHFWCLSFFLMLFTVAVGTEIALMETIMTVIYDEFKNARPYRWLINLIFCSSLFFMGMILCTANGYFVVHLLNKMAGMMPRLIIAVGMVGTIVFIYGMRKFCEDMHFMLNYYPNLFIRFCLFITPFLLLALTIPSWVLEESTKIMGLVYKTDAIIVGWCIICFILMWILLGGVYWYIYCRYIGHPNYIWRSLNSWGPRNFAARVARTEFSSDNVSNFTKPWKKKNDMEQDEDKIFYIST